MSFNNKKIIEVKSPLKLSENKNYNYFTILKNENTSLSNEIIKGNDLINKLKKKILNNEQEKKELLLTNNKKDKEIKEIKKKLEETKEKITEIQEKIKKFEENDIKENNKQNNNLNNNIQYTIIKLQNKITELEFQLKNKKINNKRFISLEKKRSVSMLYKSTNNYIFKNNTINNNDDLFLTGRNESKEYQEKNILLECKLNKLKIDLNNIEIERNNLIKLLEQYSTEKKKMLSTLNEKNEKINDKLNGANNLNDNIMKQILENKKYNYMLFQIKIKKQNLEKDIFELENIIMKQKNKINDLSTSVENIVKIVENKNNEIKSNKNYIFNLENNIKEINKKFSNIKQNKYTYNNIKKEELPKLLEQIEKLKKEYIYLIEKNKNSLKFKNNIKINYNIINNNGNNIIKDLNKYNFNKSKNISIIPNERYENKIQKIYHNQNNYHSRNKFNELNGISPNNQRKIISETRIRNINNISENVLNKKLLNNYNYKKFNIDNYNKMKIKIKSNNRDIINYFNSNSMRNIKNYKINMNSQKVLKKINIIKFKKRVNSSININNINNIKNKIQKKNMKSFSGIDKNNLISEHEKINEFKDFLDKIISDFEN